jgi:hypothetical protein
VRPVYPQFVGNSGSPQTAKAVKVELNVIMLTLLSLEGSPQEADEEGHPVLPNGLWCFWNWYAQSQPTNQLLISSLDGLRPDFSCLIY